MTVIDTLTQRNHTFASEHFSKDLKIIPSLKTMVIGCVDPRVDPADILGLSLGEAAVLRNVGGRVTPATIASLDMLSLVAKAGGGQFGPGWNLIVLHHTDCGITRLGHSPALLADYFGVAENALEACAINDPYASVAVDVAAIKAAPSLSDAFVVSGLVYDVATGRIDTVVAPGQLRG